MTATDALLIVFANPGGVIVLTLVAMVVMAVVFAVVWVIPCEIISGWLHERRRRKSVPSAKMSEDE